MKLIGLFVQYKHNEGPELYDAVDEFTQDDNPQYLEDKIAAVKKNTEIVDFQLIDIVVPTKDILDAFKRPTVTGEVKAS